MVSNLFAVHVASELAPIAKAGGLADVVYGLARATVQKGHRVEIWLPKYDLIESGFLTNLHRKEEGLWSAQLEDLTLFLIDEPAYFHRGMIYGCTDDVERFFHFTSRFITYIQKKAPPHVIHFHDWETSLIALFVRAIKKWQRPRLLFTIHNLEYQGRCFPEQIPTLSKKEQAEIQDPQVSNALNLLLSGIRFSDFITTVSPTYRKEILTKKGGCGLDAVLSHYQQKLYGILNGIDYSYWNPENDRYLPHPYTVYSLEKKAANKRSLRKQLQLQERDCPLVAVITRLVPQKGPKLIEEGLCHVLKKGGQCVLVGSTPIPEIAKQFQILTQQLPTNQATFFLDYDEPLAHLVYAAADFLLIPSISEPCGLTQMIALRYGTIPIVHSTGGLQDTIFDWETSKEPISKRNGFTFQRPDPIECIQAIDRALALYQNKPNEWRQLMQQAMRQDFSWSRSLQEYLALYLQNPL